MARIPAVPITFGGENRNLIFDYNAKAEMQDITGGYASNVAHLKAVRTATWALLLAETLDSRGRETARTLSLTQVGEIIEDLQDSGLLLLLAAVKKAIGIAEPEPTADPTPATEAATILPV